MTNTEKKELGLDKPPRYTYHDVIDDIKASKEISEEYKVKAVEEIERLISSGQINLLEVKNHSGNIGTKLGGLFTWTESNLGQSFWMHINNQLNIL